MGSPMGRREEEIARLQDAAEARRAVEAAEVRAEARATRRSATITAIVVAVLGAIGPVTAAVLPAVTAAPVYDCMESYEQAIDLYEEHGVVITLPESHPEEQQCDVSGRLEELRQSEPPPPDAQPET